MLSRLLSLVLKITMLATLAPAGTAWPALGPLANSAVDPAPPSAAAVPAAVSTEAGKFEMKRPDTSEKRKRSVTVQPANSPCTSNPAEKTLGRWPSRMSSVPSRLRSSSVTARVR